MLIVFKQLRQLQIGKIDCSHDVEIRGGFFKMLPDTWSDSNWEIKATVRPALVSTIVNVCTIMSERMRKRGVR